ncbi:MAG: hypothetical protein ACRD2S_00100 [Terriglobales bacterium]
MTTWALLFPPSLCVPLRSVRVKAILTLPGPALAQLFVEQLVATLSVEGEQLPLLLYGLLGG